MTDRAIQVILLLRKCFKSSSSRFQPYLTGFERCDGLLGGHVAVFHKVLLFEVSSESPLDILVSHGCDSVLIGHAHHRRRRCVLRSCCARVEVDVFKLAQSTEGVIHHGSALILNHLLSSGPSLCLVGLRLHTKGCERLWPPDRQETVRRLPIALIHLKVKSLVTSVDFAFERLREIAVHAVHFFIVYLIQRHIFCPLHESVCCFSVFSLRDEKRPVFTTYLSTNLTFVPLYSRRITNFLRAAIEVVVGLNCR